MTLAKKDVVLILTVIIFLSMTFYMGREKAPLPINKSIEYSKKIHETEMRLANSIQEMRYQGKIEQDKLKQELDLIHLYSENLKSEILNYINRDEVPRFQKINTTVAEKYKSLQFYVAEHQELNKTVSELSALHKKIELTRKGEHYEPYLKKLELLKKKFRMYPAGQIDREIRAIKKDMVFIAKGLNLEAQEKDTINFIGLGQLLTGQLRTVDKFSLKLVEPGISSEVFVLLNDLFMIEEKRRTSSNIFYGLEYTASLFLVFYLAYLLLVIRKKSSTLESGSAKLLVEKEKMLATLSSLADGVIKISPSGHVLFINDVAKKMMSLSETEGAGQPLKDIITVYKIDTDEPVLDVISECRGRSEAHHKHRKYVLHGKTGKEYIVELNYVPIHSDEEISENFVLVIHDVSENHHLIEHMLYQASHDSLTGLLNRSGFEKKILKAISISKKAGIKHVLLYIDIDQFKLINDTSGHLVGDELLRRVALNLERFVGNNGIVSRLGGDEFGILFENHLLTQIEPVAWDLLEFIKVNRFRWSGSDYEVTASIGIVEIDPHTEDLREVMAHADIAAYTAKDLGRNRVHVFVRNDVILAKRHQELTWASKITRALDEERFKCYYQSIIPVNAKCDFNKVEILVRLIDDEGNYVSPGDFIPAAERYNLMGQIDRWVVAVSLKTLYRIQSELGIKNYQFCVNLSGNSLSDPGFLNYVLETLITYPIELNTLCFEITETAAISNLSSATNLIEQLKDRGIMFALDDFGSGLSSFSYLKNLDVDFLKIDGVFVRNLTEENADLVIVDAINQVGHAMNMQTVAEFVENDTILTRLREIGVDYAQGYAIAVPEPLDDLIQFHKQQDCARRS